MLFYYKSLFTKEYMVIKRIYNFPKNIGLKVKYMDRLEFEHRYIEGL